MRRVLETCDHFDSSDVKNLQGIIISIIIVIIIYNKDIGMEFSIEKCAMLIMKNRKKETTLLQTEKRQKLENRNGEKTNV